MRVQFNNGRHFSSTNGFIHKTVFGNSTEICKVCDQYSTNVVKKQLRVYSTNFSWWLMYCSQIYVWLFIADNYHFLLDWFSHIPDENR